MMKRFARRYTYYFFICAGTMVMAFVHLTLGQYTASIIYGTEITDETICFAQWFILLAPAFLTWLTLEDTPR